jgi:hypothetical protein
MNTIPPGPNQAPKVGEVEEDAVKAVVAVHECKIEPTLLREEAWKSDL